MVNTKLQQIGEIIEKVGDTLIRLVSLFLRLNFLVLSLFNI